MNMENIAFLLFGMSIATLLRNVIDYYHNTKYLNSDAMGASINWDYEFALSWLFLCAGIMIYPGIRWFYGLIMIPGLFIATFIKIPLYNSMKGLGLIEKERKNT